MRIEDMNEGVQILLARMKTHPEEFISSGKWQFVHQAIKEDRLTFLYPEEIEVLEKGLKDTYREKFTTMVIKKLTENGQGELF
jgi:hypothetical protein